MLHLHAAGIAVQDDMHMVCVPADRVSASDEASGFAKASGDVEVLMDVGKVNTLDGWRVIS